MYCIETMTFTQYQKFPSETFWKTGPRFSTKLQVWVTAFGYAATSFAELPRHLHRPEYDKIAITFYILIRILFAKKKSNIWYPYPY